MDLQIENIPMSQTTILQNPRSRCWTGSIILSSVLTKQSQYRQVHPWSYQYRKTGPAFVVLPFRVHKIPQSMASSRIRRERPANPAKAVQSKRKSGSKPDSESQIMRNRCSWTTGDVCVLAISILFVVFRNVMCLLLSPPRRKNASLFVSAPVFIHPAGCLL